MSVAPNLDPSAATAEFDRQVETLVRLGYPSMTGLGAAAFAELLAPLRREAELRGSDLATPTRGRVPFLVVVSGRIAPPDEAILRTTLQGRPGFVSADTSDINSFHPIEGLSIPDAGAYLLLDVDRGRETLNATPDEAVQRFERAGRTPLTIDEGIAFITAYPESLEKNNCFQTPGSRIGDRRVPGLWISKRRPKLGYCWAGNRHTWLGAASCAERVAA